MSQWDDNEDPYNAPYYGDGGGPAAPTTQPTAAKRFNTTPAWGDPLHAPHPSDPYYAEWQAANPGIPESADPPIGTQIDVYGNPYGNKLNDPNTPNPGPPVPSPGGGGGPSLITPFTEPYVPAGSGSPTPTPLPTLGPIEGAPTFAPPSIGEAMNDPGYKFTLDQGNNNLQNWAAARGTLNDSSTAKAMIDYGQGAAATQYGTVWDRAAQNWKQAFDTWQTGTVNPAMTNFATQAANVSHLNDTRWQDNWNKYLQDWNVFRDQRDSTFNKQFQTATA